MAELLMAILRLASIIGEALITGDTTRVDEVMPQTLRSSIVQAGKDAEAVEKFGPRK